MVKHFFVLASIFVGIPIKAEQKRFVIDICSYNNRNWYRDNLRSVFNQDYPHYRVIYTNDCSSDGTGDLVAAMVKEYGKTEQVRIIHNPQRCRMLANHWRVIHQCDDDEIIVHLDGDDTFAHDHVLTLLNEAYQNDKVWMTYGSYEFWPDHTPYKLDIIPEHVIRQGSYRVSCFCKSPYHPRTFYAWLAKRIKVEDLLLTHGSYAGQFIPAISDWSLLYPLFEMAAGKFLFIDDILYSFNTSNPLSHDKKKDTLHLQQQCAAFICRKKPYCALSHPVRSRAITERKCTVIIETHDQRCTRRLAKSIKEYVKGVDAIYFAARHDVINTGSSSFIFYVSDDVVVSDAIDLSLCCQMLEKTGAHAWYFQMDHLPTPKVWLEGNTYGFQYMHADSFSPKAYICKKNCFSELRKKMQTIKPFKLFDYTKVGLCYADAKISYQVQDKDI